MSLTIEGIPESVTRQQVVALLETLGLDPSVVTRDGIHIGWEAVTCTVFALDENGRRYADTNGEMVCHEVAVRVIDHDEPKDQPNQ